MPVLFGVAEQVVFDEAAIVVVPRTGCQSDDNVISLGLIFCDHHLGRARWGVSGAL